MNPAGDRHEIVHLAGDQVVERFVVGKHRANAYLAYDPNTSIGFAVDPGADEETLLARVAELRLTIGAIVLTHAHWDHVGAARALAQVSGAPVYLQERDRAALKLAPVFALRVDQISLAVPSNVTTFAGRASHALEPGREVCMLHTPGHSEGGAIIRSGRAIFTGDTLLREEVGRTDLAGGSDEKLPVSLDIIRQELRHDDCVFPGHGRPWSGEEALAWLDSYVTKAAAGPSR